MVPDLAERPGFVFDRELRPPRSWFLAAAEQPAAETAGKREEFHGPIAFDHRLSRACHRPAMDRARHRRHSLAAVELHGQSIAMGRLWRPARRGGPDPDLAGQPLDS